MQFLLRYVLTIIAALQPHILIFGSMLIYNPSAFKKFDHISISRLSLETKTTKLALQLASYINGSISLLLIPQILKNISPLLSWIVAYTIFLCFFISAYFLDTQHFKLHTRFAKYLALFILLAKILFAWQTQAIFAWILAIGDMIFAYWMKFKHHDKVKGTLELYYLICLSIWMLYTLF